MANILAQLGAYVIDADQLAREVVRAGSPALQEITTTFGPAVIREDGELDRQALGEIVFSSLEQRRRLEAIIHPRVRSLYLNKIQDIPAQAKLCVYAVPLFFETLKTNATPGEWSHISASITVYAPRAICIKRIMARDGLSEAAAAARYDAQIPGDEKIRLADYVINNSGDNANLSSQVFRIYQEIIDSSS